MFVRADTISLIILGNLLSIKPWNKLEFNDYNFDALNLISVKQKRDKDKYIYV